MPTPSRVCPVQAKTWLDRVVLLIGPGVASRRESLDPLEVRQGIIAVIKREAATDRIKRNQPGSGRLAGHGDDADPAPVSAVGLNEPTPDQEISPRWNCLPRRIGFRLAAAVTGQVTRLALILGAAGQAAGQSGSWVSTAHWTAASVSKRLISRASRIDAVVGPGRCQSCLFSALSDLTKSLTT